MFEEKTVEKHVVFEGKIIRVRKDDAALPDGTPCTREVVEHGGGACILCVVDGKVVLVRQFRYAYGETLWEIPAGKLERGEDPKAAALRELGEETGFVAEDAKPLFTLYPTPGYCNEKIYLFEAVNVREGARHPDAGELLETRLVPLGEAYDMLARGEIKDGKTAVALLLYKERT